MSTALSPERLSPPSSQRLILARVGAVTLAIPTTWVAEILRVSRAQLLDLPFYDPMVLGVIHHSSGLLPLVLAQRLLHLPDARLRETAVVISLGTAAANLAHIGLVVDQLLGSTTRVPPAMTSWTPATQVPPQAETTVLLDAQWLPANLWHPQQWCSSSNLVS